MEKNDFPLFSKEENDVKCRINLEKRRRQEELQRQRARKRWYYERVERAADVAMMLHMCPNIDTEEEEEYFFWHSTTVSMMRRN